MLRRIVELGRLKGDTPIERAIQADLHAHWIDGVLPEEVVRVNKRPNGIEETDPLLVYNDSYGVVDIGHRRKVRGEWEWVAREGKITHWMLLPLSPTEQQDESRLEMRRIALEKI